MSEPKTAMLWVPSQLPARCPRCGTLVSVGDSVVASLSAQAIYVHWQCRDLKES